MTTPEGHKWEEDPGIGSAKYFGQFLSVTRQNYQHNASSWASLGHVELERYKRIEIGKELNPPSLNELNEWTRGWRLTRDEIIDLKMSGGYDISTYLGSIDPQTLARALTVLLRRE